MSCPGRLSRPSGPAVGRRRGGALRRFYTKQHQFYGGIDLHARTMYLCVLNQEGESLLHRTMKAGPEPFLQAITLGFRRELEIGAVTQRTEILLKLPGECCDRVCVCSGRVADHSTHA
jgi:hypothetical protein